MPNSDLRRRFVLGLGGTTALAAAQGTGARNGAHQGIFNVVDYGAAADGARLNTKPIQDAIDACARAGGGRVYFPAGKYVSGTLVLKDNVTLELEAGATLLGSRNLDDYPVHVADMRSYTDNYTDKSLIYAENLQNIAIQGHGIIDGQGAAFKGPYKVRPYLMRFIGCRGVSVSGVTIKDSPMWVQHYLGCDEVDIRSIRVHSRVNGNNDGIDIDCCQRVRISDCEIWSGDDAIVLKSTANRPCKDMVIANCVLSSTCNALKLGTETNGGFENIAISNCSIYDTRLSGVTLQIVDGGTLDRVTVSNIAMVNVTCPLFIRLGDRARPFQNGGERPAMGRMRNITISNIEATGARRTGCAIAGLPGHAIENVTIENMRLAFEGGGTSRDAQRQVPENPERYPEYNMFGVLPAYALYCRHVKNLSLRNIQASFADREERPAMICEDVEALEIAGASLAGGSETQPSIRLARVKDAFIHGCRVPGATPAFMEVDSECAGVALVANELSRARNAVTGSGASRVFLGNNHLA